METEVWVKALEQATAKLQTVPRGDFAGMIKAMNRRSRAVNHLLDHVRNSPGPASEEIIARVRRDRALGADTREKLLLMRAEAHSEISRTAESSYLMRALARKPERKARRVDCKV